MELQDLKFPRFMKMIDQSEALRNINGTRIYNNMQFIGYCMNYFKFDISWKENNGGWGV